MRNTLFLGLAVVAVIFSGCTTSQKQNVYQTGSVQQQMRVKLATVIDVRDVDIEAKPTGAGATAGAAAGGVVGTNTGRGGVVSGIAGTVIGGVAGAVGEKLASGNKGQEVIYQVDGSKETLALVQELDSDPLKPGDRVRLIEGALTARLVKLPKAQM